MEKAEPPYEKGLREIIQDLADITKTYISKGHDDLARKYIGMVSKMFNEGDVNTKNLIRTIYIFSVSTFLEIKGRSICDLFNDTLKDEYYMQVNASGL